MKKAPKTSLVNESKIIKPYSAKDGEYDDLLELAFEIVILFDKDFVQPIQMVSEEKERKDYYYTRYIRQYGSKDQGFKVVWQQDEVEIGSITLTADTVEIEAVGLPQHEALKLRSERPPNNSQSNRTLLIEFSGPKAFNEQIMELINSKFFVKAFTKEEITAITKDGMNKIFRGNWDGALQDITPILQADPENIDAWFIYGVANGAKGNIPVAKEYLNKVVEKKPDHYDGWYNLALANLESKELDEAIKCFKSALEVDPTNHAVFYQLGKALKEAKRTDEAIEAFQYAVLTSPNPNDAWHYTGMDFTKYAKEELQKLGKPWTGKENLKPIEKKKEEIVEKLSKKAPKKAPKGSAKKAPKKDLKTTPKKPEEKAPKQPKKELNEELSRAVYEGNVEKVKEALDNGANPNAKSKYNRTVLIGACDYQGKPEIVKMLLERGAEVNVREVNGETPLTYASMYDHLEIVEMLLKAGADVNLQGGYGRTALMYAAINAAKSETALKIFQILLDKGADLSLTTEGGDNILLEMLWNKEVSAKVVELLIKRDIDLEFRTKYYHGVTALIRAANSGHFEIVKLLVGNGADIKAKTGDGESAFSEATRANHGEIANFLLEQGVDPNTPDHFKDPVLNRAAQNGNFELVKSMVEKGADVNKKGDLDETPIMNAAWKRDFRIVEYLVEHGADVNALDFMKETALMKACRKGHLNVVEKLLENGANLESQDNKGNSPLLFAAYEGQTQMIDLLLKKGANIHAKNNLDWNALMQACEEGHYDAAKLLVEKGSKINEIEKEKGVTALMLAIWKGSESIVKLLLENGTDTTIKDKNGDMARDYAAKAHRNNLVKLIDESNIRKDTKDAPKKDPSKAQPRKKDSLKTPYNLDDLKELTKKLTLETQRLCGIIACEEALKVWKAFVPSIDFYYADSVVGVAHDIKLDLPERALEAVRIKKLELVNSIYQEYLEPIVAIQDEDWSLPEPALMAFYSVYNLLDGFRSENPSSIAISINQAHEALVKWNPQEVKKKCGDNVFNPWWKRCVNEVEELKFII